MNSIYLTDLEWEVMSHIWDLGKDTSVRDVLETAYPDDEKAYTTVQTVMNNLVEKGYLKKKMIGLVNFYTPAKRKNKILKHETQRFVKKAFDGSFGSLASFLITSETLSNDQIEELKKLISKHEDD